MGSRFASLAGRTFDLIVVGGGIIGCGIARDAALRGLRVALFEKEDFGYGTSSRSTRLIHGGLRYLEQFDFGLVRQDLKEREILLRIAPHRVKPLPFLVPFYDRSPFYRLKLRAGMLLYDLLSYDKSLPNHRMLSREATLRREPALSPEGLQGAALYYDARAEMPELLCLDNILDAEGQGAQVFNHAAATELLYDAEERVCGVRVQDTETAEVAEARGSVVVNASGPWADALNQQVSLTPQHRLRLTKGIHFTTPNAPQNALVLFSRRDDRLFFVIPWLEYAWVGTTDTDFSDDLDTVHATPEDVAYLLESARPLLPGLDWETIYFTNAGVRALVRSGNAHADESDVSRKHRLLAHTAQERLQNLISVLGGKLTAYRDIAEETVTLAISQLGLPPRPSRTAQRPLPGGDFTHFLAVQTECRQRAAEVGLSAAQADHLFALYGARYTEVLRRIARQPELGERIAPAYLDVKAQIEQALADHARTLADFFLRRSKLGFSPDQGLAASPVVAAEMARRLDWDETRREEEIARYQAQVELTQRWRTRSPKPTP